MIKIHKTRIGCIKLYNPEVEGLADYDLNYINAYKKNKLKIYSSEQRNNERYAA